MQQQQQQGYLSSSSDALADRLSSSLANIVASGRRDQEDSERRVRWGLEGKVDDLPLQRRGDDEGFGSNHSSEDGSGEGGLSSTCSSSSNSSRNTGEQPHRSHPAHASGREADDAALVSNATGSSGGDDRDSSTAGREEGSSNKDSSSSDSGARSNEGGASNNNKSLPSLPSNEHAAASRSHHFHHHHHYHTSSHQDHPQRASDGYGLPVMKEDDRVASATGGSRESHHHMPEQHSAVMAHRLPPPQSSSTSSSSSSLDAAANSSGGDSDRGRGKGGGGQHRHVRGNDSRYEPGTLVQPRHEPGFHTIKRTFNRFTRRTSASASGAADAAHKRSAETDSSEEQPESHHPYRHKSSAKRAAAIAKASALPPVADSVVSSKKRKLPHRPQDAVATTAGSDNDDESGGGSGGSSSGTEGGYAGSASSNENGSAGETGSTCSSSEDRKQQHKRSRTGHHPAHHSSTMHPSRPLLSRKQESSLSLSSEIADFSTGSDDDSEGARRGSFAAAFSQSSRSPSITSSDDQDDDEDPPVTQGATRKRHTPGWLPPQLQVPTDPAMESSATAITHLAQKIRRPSSVVLSRGTGNLKSDLPTLDGKPPILAVGCDVMAHVLTFLEPPDVLDVLTMPLSKDWVTGFTRQPELWRVLCLLDPFKAQIENHEPGGANSTSSNSSSDGSVDSDRDEAELRKSVGSFRLLYTSFVRCLRYLSRIKDDALNGRPPSVVDYGVRPMAPNRSIQDNEHLHEFLARARGVVLRDRSTEEAAMEGSDISDDDNPSDGGGPAAAAAAASAASAIGVSDDGSAASLPRGCSDNDKAASVKGKSAAACKKKKRVKYGHSMLTQRLLGPSADGTPGNNDLPWSCAIYSIVNWMVAFSDVEGIQTMCLKVLPFILEDEQQRMTAQRAGCTDIVLRGMVMFPDSSMLHTAAFHTLVLLARPLGGREGMLFHSSMVNSSGIFSAENGSSDGRNGIAVMLDSMRRFQDNEVLQAMSCWSLVNIALATSQKEMLVKLGGIEVTANAMTTHPYSAEVNFRGLFALINLVIPSVNVSEDQEGGAEGAGAIVPVEDTSEREMLDEMVDHLVNLVVRAMKNFCASEAILNRACLVLHNLSLTQGTPILECWFEVFVFRRDELLNLFLLRSPTRLSRTPASDSQLLPDAGVVPGELPNRPSPAAERGRDAAPPPDHPQRRRRPEDPVRLVAPAAAARLSRTGAPGSPFAEPAARPTAAAPRPGIGLGGFGAVNNGSRRSLRDQSACILTVTP